MKAIARATGFFLFVRIVLAAIVVTPLGLALRGISSRHPDADDVLFVDLAARLGDVGLREPRVFVVTVSSLLLGVVLAPLGEGLVDRIGTAMLVGRRMGDALADSAREAFRLGGVSLFGTLFRLAGIACVIGLFRHRELSMPALALPLTISVLLVGFVGIVLGLRDLAFWPGPAVTETLRARMRVALLVLLDAPLRMTVLALGTRALSLAFTSIAFVASTSPTPVHGLKLLGVYALALACLAAASLTRALRFAGLGALTERVTPAGARRDDRFVARDVPNLDPIA